MNYRRVGLWMLFGLLAVLAGCQGPGTDTVTLETEVRDVTEHGDEWRLEIAVSSSASSTDHRWENVTVSGHGVDSGHRCEIDLGTVDPGTTARGVLTCDRLPFTFVVRSESLETDMSRIYEDPRTYKGSLSRRITREDTPDVLLRTEAVALEWFNESGPGYGDIPHLHTGVSEIEISAFDYARCRTIVSAAERSDFEGDTSWLDRDVGAEQIPNETRIVATETDGPAVTRDNRTLRAVEFPITETATRLRAAIRATGQNGSDADIPHYELLDIRRNGPTTVTYRYTGSRAELASLHGSLLYPGTAERPDVRFSEVADRAANETVGHATGIETLSSEVVDSCAEPHRFRSYGTTGAVYVVRIDGQPWTISVTSEFRRPPSDS